MLALALVLSCCGVELVGRSARLRVGGRLVGWPPGRLDGWSVELLADLLRMRPSMQDVLFGCLIAWRLGCSIAGLPELGCLIACWIT